MKIIIFDIEDAACTLICSPKGYGMMIDCGCAAKDSSKMNPIDIIANNSEWISMKPYVTQEGKSYPLALLHITHPDDDHVRNSKRIRSELTPYLLRRTDIEEFPDSDKINNDYKVYIDNYYRGSNPETVGWGFEEDKQFQIPMNIIKNSDGLKNKIRNNSSIIRYIKYAGKSILFAGDLETPGWDWLAENDSNFITTMKSGIDILIAPHHGHKSGFPKSLFELTGNVGVIIHSKGSEGNIEGTDVASQYSGNADGVKYNSLNDKKYYHGKVMTTRSNGNIFIKIDNSGSLYFWANKASPNHTLIR
jgi:hypothetical protein